MPFVETVPKKLEGSVQSVMKENRHLKRQLWVLYIYVLMVVEGM